MSTWYRTFGYPCGEIAGRDRDKVVTRSTKEAPCWIERTSGSNPQPIAHAYYSYCVGPCSPELTEWIEFGPLWSRTKRKAGDFMQKVPGGYLLTNASYGGGQSFIPVAGAADLTVLEAPDA